MSTRAIIVFIAIRGVYPISNSYAVPPPDIIINIVSQMSSVLSLGLAFVGGIIVLNLASIKIFRTKYQKFIIVIITSLLVCGSIFYIVNNIRYGQESIRSYYYDQLRIDMHTERLAGGKMSHLVNLTGSLINEDLIPPENTFFEQYSGTSIIISNDELQDKIIQGDNDYLILDAREDLEYIIGNIPLSKHVRFIDIKDGMRTDLPKNKFIYVVCWSGIRGKEVTEYLRAKNVVARYLEQGAYGWKDYGGSRTGEIDFFKYFNKLTYKKLLSKQNVIKEIAKGTLLIDSRDPITYQQKHISGSINISTDYTPTRLVESIFGSIGSGKRVITICDSYVNCLDAKMTGIELENRGNTLVGIYNKPYEF